MKLTDKLPKRFTGSSFIIDGNVNDEILTRLLEAAFRDLDARGDVEASVITVVAVTRTSDTRTSVTLDLKSVELGGRHVADAIGRVAERVGTAHDEVTLRTPPRGTPLHELVPEVAAVRVMLLPPRFGERLQPLTPPEWSDVITQQLLDGCEQVWTVESGRCEADLSDIHAARHWQRRIAESDRGASTRVLTVTADGEWQAVERQGSLFLEYLSTATPAEVFERAKAIRAALDPQPVGAYLTLHDSILTPDRDDGFNVHASIAAWTGSSRLWDATPALWPSDALRAQLDLSELSAGELSVRFEEDWLVIGELDEWADPASQVELRQSARTALLPWLEVRN